MPLDPQARKLLDQMAALGAPPLGTLPAPQARAAMKGRPTMPGPAVYRSENYYVAGPAGAVPIRIYTPLGAGPFPALVWYHGGGWVFGDLDGADGTARHLCVGAGCVVVSVDYRLAPEAKFPAAADDCYAAAAWTVKNASMLNVDPKKVAVGGDSAGGNLAAAVTLMARDRNGPKLAAQVLAYPVTDWNFSTKSYTKNANGYLLTKSAMVWFWDEYLSKASDIDNPYAAPMKAKSLKGLPPALVLTAEFDPLRDEGEAYATRLQKDGVRTVYTLYPGMIHGFFGMSAVLDKGKQAVRQATDFLSETYGGSSAGGRAQATRRPAARARATKKTTARAPAKAAPKTAGRTTARTPARATTRATARPSASRGRPAAARRASRR
ncbi:MAG: alpha/beta hydrolase [Dehalococcoidia bacterium]|nr:alpha/beta hydrolase [Dehalococcoidia bacterium]